MAHVGGVEGYYTCDGGCDKATVTDAYAKEIIKAVGAYHEYDRPLMATLANGETKPIIKGYIRADVEVTTPAGNVVLTNWHVDVMQGPTSEKLLYMGQREERELNLKSSGERILLYATYTDPHLHIYVFFASLYVATIHLLSATIRRFLKCVYAPANERIVATYISAYSCEKLRIVVSV